MTDHEHIPVIEVIDDVSRDYVLRGLGQIVVHEYRSIHGTTEGVLDERTLHVLHATLRRDHVISFGAFRASIERALTA